MGEGGRGGRDGVGEKGGEERGDGKWLKCWSEGSEM